MAARLFWVRRRAISSCWAASRASAWSLKPLSMVIVVSRSASRCLSCGDLVLEAGDLGVAAVGDVAGLLAGLEPGLEFLAEVGVGPGAVEGGPVDGCLAGEGLDVALAAGRDVAGEEPVDGGPDPGLVLLALVGADAHYCWAPFWPAAVSISVRTRLARS